MLKIKEKTILELIDLQTRLMNDDLGAYELWSDITENLTDELQDLSIYLNHLSLAGLIFLSFTNRKAFFEARPRNCILDPCMNNKAIRIEFEHEDICGNSIPKPTKKDLFPKNR